MKWLFAVMLAAGLAFIPAVEAAPIDINSADAQTLDKALIGIGPKSAQAIVEYRTKHGPFKSLDELTKVKGIGKATVEKNRANLTVGQKAAK